MMDEQSKLNYRRALDKIKKLIDNTKRLTKSNDRRKAQNENDGLFKCYIKDNYPEVYKSTVKYIIQTKGEKVK